MAMFGEARRALSYVCRLCATHHSRHGLLNTNPICSRSLLSNVDYAVSTHTESAFVQKSDDGHPKRVHSDYIFEYIEESYRPKKRSSTEESLSEYIQIKSCCISDHENDLLAQDNQELFVKNKHLLDGKYLDMLYEISNIRETLSEPKGSCTLSENGQSFFDYFTTGRCKPNTVHGVLEKSPALQLKSISNVNDKKFAESVVFCAGGSNGESSKDDQSHLPSEEELCLIKRHLEAYLPGLFSKRHDYRLYSKDLIFENNFVKKPYVSTGLTPYVMFIAKIRIWAHFKYANVKFNALKMTHHVEDGTVRVRWRMSGLLQFRALMFWKFLPWTYGNSVKSESEWLDGFSTFYVQAKTGIIIKHRVDKVIPDEETLVKDPKQKLIDKIRGGLNVGTV